MRNYRRLSGKAVKKLKFYNKTGKIAKKSFKNLGIFMFVFVMLLAGAIAFFSLLDSNIKDEPSPQIAAVNSQDFTKEKELSFTDATKSELEREAERNNILSKEAEKNKKEQEEEKDEISHDFSKWNETCKEELFIVNKFNPASEKFIPKLKLCRGKEVAFAAVDDLENMICAAKKDNVVLWISSAYRDFFSQAELFERQAENEFKKEIISWEEAEKRAGKTVAKAGESEHITGLAIDFNGVEQNFYLTHEYKWLMDNAHNFGFIERYQKKWSPSTGIFFEPWHFRFVGKELAPKIKESGLSLEEYLIKNCK